MKVSPIIEAVKSEGVEQVKCIVKFILVISPFIFIAVVLKGTHPLASQLLLLFAGWLTWTFMEYFNHRFESHYHGGNKTSDIFKRHMHHHCHPTEIRITAKQRLILLGGNFLLITASVFLQNWFVFLTGIYSGLVIYSFIHVILHQRWSSKLFPKLQQYHIHHHCKYPNRCFGVSIIWWDSLFHTAPPKDASISKRVRDFYFGI